MIHTDSGVLWYNFKIKKLFKLKLRYKLYQQDNFILSAFQCFQSRNLNKFFNKMSLINFNLLNKNL